MPTSEVSLTAGIRANLLLLQNTNRATEETQLRLATGNKVNSAIDGPNAFFAAAGLNQRAGDLTTLKDAIGQAISTITAADKGISAIEDLLDQARALTTTAFQNLGTDANSVATRRSLAQQFNTIKEQIDKIANDSEYQGRNLLVGNGLALDSTSDSRQTVNSITAVSNARVTNVVSTDTYSLSFSGTGEITGSAGDIAAAETSRGLVGLTISGTLSASQGNFSDISIEIRGAVGRERTAVVTENGESRTIRFFDNTQAATTELNQAGAQGTAQVSAVTITGAIEEGDSFTVTVNGRAFTYTASAGDVTDADPAVRQESVATALQGLVDAGLTASGFTIGTVSSGSSSFTITAAATSGTGVSFTLGASTTNALERDVSISFSSGSVISFTVDRRLLEARDTAANGVSTIEKFVDIDVTATNLQGVSITRSGTNERGAGKLADGENAFSFASGTVRIDVDATEIQAAASTSAFANLITVQRTDPNTANDLSVQFNEDNSSFINVVSQNLRTDGQGLRLDFAQNDFLDREDIEAAVDQLDFAVSTLRSASQSLSTNLSIIETRDNFTTEFSNVLVDGANRLVQADQNEEGANLLLLQTRQQLGTISLSIANQSQQAILRLF